MHIRLRAPLLSAAVSRVRIWILVRSQRRGPVDDPHQRPALAPGQRAAGRDGDHVALAALVFLIVRQELGGAAHVLAVVRMLDQALHRHGDGLVHLAADHTTGERTLRLALGLVVGRHRPSPWTRFWFSTVLTRAIERRTRRNWSGLAGWPAAAPMRRLN